MTMRGVTAVLPLHFAGKKLKEKKVKKVTKQTADQARSTFYCSYALRTRKFQHVFRDHRRRGVCTLFQNVKKQIPLTLCFTC